MSTILIVDDDNIFRSRMAKAFSRRDYEVFDAASYDEAMEILQKQAIDMALFDLKMEGKNGLILVRDSIKLQPGLRIIVLTGYGSIATATEAIKLGALAYLAKPASLEEIQSAFEEKKAYLEPEEQDIKPPSLARVEWEHIQRVLADCDGNISAAAKKLGIHRRTLQRKLFKYAPK